MQKKEEKPKRGPGRPPSDIKKTQVKNFGVCDFPLNEEHRVEFICKYPTLYKKLYGLYKNTDVIEIVFCFSQSTLNMFGVNGSLEVINNTLINCNNIYRYYCTEDIMFTMTKNVSEKVINRIDTKHYDTMQIIVKDTSELVNNIEILLCNSSMDCKSIHVLGVNPQVSINLDDNLYGNLWDEKLYPVSFTLPHKLFKKYITDIQNIVSSNGTLRIQSILDDSLAFEYSDDCRSVVAREEFNKTKIKLKHSGDAFVIANSIIISNLKKLSGSEISDTVTIYIDIYRDMMCVFNMDDSMVTKSLIKIVDLRQA